MATQQPLSSVIQPPPGFAPRQDSLNLDNIQGDILLVLDALTLLRTY